MAAQQSIDSLFSSVRRFKWSFTDGFNPTSVSCIAFSVEEARERLLSYLAQIESLQEEKKLVDQQVSALLKTNTYSVVASEVTRIEAELFKKLPPLDNNTGCFCASVFDFSRHMKICDYTNVTLGEFVSTTAPTEHRVNLVDITSCLDG
jgi:hypothetical protein